MNEVKCPNCKGMMHINNSFNSFPNYVCDKYGWRKNCDTVISVKEYNQKYKERKVILMNFSQALEALKQGKKVARSIWGGYWVICFVQFNEGDEGQDDYYVPNHDTTMIMAKLKDGGYAPAQPYQADLLAEDWMIVE